VTEDEKPDFTLKFCRSESLIGLVVGTPRCAFAVSDRGSTELRIARLLSAY
jgi:hypothetical protein